MKIEAVDFFYVSMPEVTTEADGRPLYSIRPSFRNLFIKKLIRERVVPTLAVPGKEIRCDYF
jgi:hypothetical protein